MISLNKDILAQIIKLITDYKQPEKIVIFGSRATNTSKTASDIDIAIFGREWTDRDINLVKNILEEKIKTPLKFDVINFYAINKNTLRQDIIQEGKVIYDCPQG
jgi:predicted nucleotidyltransferase